MKKIGEGLSCSSRNEVIGKLVHIETVEDVINLLKINNKDKIIEMKNYYILIEIMNNIMGYYQFPIRIPKMFASILLYHLSFERKRNKILSQYKIRLSYYLTFYNAYWETKHLKDDLNITNITFDFDDCRTIIQKKHHDLYQKLSSGKCYTYLQILSAIFLAITRRTNSNFKCWRCRFMLKK